MSRPEVIVLRTHLASLGSFRGLRMVLILAVISLGAIGLVFTLQHLFPGPFGNALSSLRLALIVPGVPLAALLMSEMALRDGITQRTLLYSLLGPAPRTTLALVRTAVTAVILALGVSALLVLTRLLEGASFAPLPREILGVTLGSFAYVALFGAIHLLVRRGLVAGLVLFFLLDRPLAQLPFTLRRLSPSYHLSVIADRVLEFHFPITVQPPEPSMPAAILVLAGMSVVFLALGAWLFARKSLGELC